AALVQAAKGEIKPGDKIPDELIGQAIKHVVMHEVGHTLGLRHNFKASAMLPNDKLNDTSITRKQGLVGSVMDYSPINLAPKGVKQGDYFSTTLGPYDYWAIEYAYKPLSGGTEGELEELQKIGVKGVKQHEALKFLQDHILNDKPFQFTPELLRKLAADRWRHWGNERMAFTGVEFPLYERILAIQRVVLEHAFDPDVLSRIQNNALKTEKGDEPLTMAEVFRSITDGIWNEPKDSDKNGNGSSIIRRNLQREHVKRLTSLVLGRRPPVSLSSFDDLFAMSIKPPPPDAGSLARMHLKDVAAK